MSLAPQTVSVLAEDISPTPSEVNASCGDAVHLWLAFPEEPSIEALARENASILTDDERQQVTRFHFPRDQRRYLVTRVLVRQVLASYVNVPPQGLVFEVNEYGRPTIANSPAVHADVRFNISHTDGLIVVGIARGREIGVDVENVRAEALTDIAHRFFATTEVEQLRQLPREQQSSRFFELWTFKEAYVKARGMGLSLPLHKFAFNCTANATVELSTDGELDDPAHRWEFSQLMPTSHHMLAVCVERRGRSYPRLIVHRWGRSHVEMPAELLRRSPYA